MPVSVNKDNYPEFKQAYEKAVEMDRDEFTFNGTEINTKYAKYVCEYLDNGGTN